MSRIKLVSDLLSDGVTRTASDVFYALYSEFQGRSSKMTLASLSGTLKQMTDCGYVERVENFGPRGGYGYYRTRNT